MTFRLPKLRLGVALPAAALAASGLAVPAVSLADTAPPAGTPATVSADPLPTVQIDGIVWEQAIVGNKVYATGRFPTARPAGVAKGGAGTVTRTNLLAYDITTGQLDPSFVHSLTGTGAEGRGIAASPDGTRLYVGGTFSTVDGQPHANVAAFDLTTNKVLSGFSGTNGTVRAVAATNTQLFVGGSFSTAGGQARTKLAAYTPAGAINTGWVANVGGSTVTALAAAAGNLVVGGSFSTINGATYYSSGAVRQANGANVTPWGSQSSTYPIRMQPPAGSSASGLGITSLSTDGTQVYLTAFTYLPGVKHPGSFEGRAAISPVDGHIIWVNDCAGDSYDSFPIGQVLYSVNHSHNCSPIGGFPHQTSWRALAETTYPTGVNGPGMGGNYPSFQGQPSGTLLNWFPVLNTANVSGSGQAAWSVVGTADYVSLGGEFTQAQNKGQQGLVRYAVASKAPNALGPYAYPLAGYAVTATPADATGRSTVRTYVTGDPDNGLLTYNVYREGSTTLLASSTVDSRYWKGTSWTFVDTGVAPGKTAWYRLVVRDPFGRSRTLEQASAVNDTDSTIVYTGAWTNSQGRGDTQPDFARGIHYTATNGAGASYAFTGTSITLISEKAANRGTATVSVDGGAATTVNMNSTSTLFQQKVFTRSGLPTGQHTIKVTKTGGTYVDVDAFAVRP